MIDWAECLKWYARYIGWEHNNLVKDWCDWYQDNCRYFMENLDNEEE
jgi:hypothetical protein